MKILTDSLHRIAYSTDASIYRELPCGVAYPESESDIISLLAEARRRGKCIIPRAGGTSIAGQVVGSGIVADISRHLDNILEINRDEKWVRVQPGVVRDELNAALKPYGLFFSPETSTSNRCCIGGMLGNNSCGTHSLVYGSTRDHVLEVRAVLSDGTVENFRKSSLEELQRRFGDKFWKSEAKTLTESVYAQLINWGLDDEISETVKNNFPERSLKRRSCGYAIDEAIEGLPSEIDICKLLVGSEGTLAFVTEIKLSLDPLPSSGKMVLCAHFNSVDDAFNANVKALGHNPVAVELIDGQILQLCKENLGQASNRFFVKGDPEALLVVEFTGDACGSAPDALESDMKQAGAYACTRVFDDDVEKVWSLRKAGLGVLTSRPSSAKPVGVVEDTAVIPGNLAAYMRDFRALMSELGLECVYYGHCGAGELHLRPQIDVKSESGRKLFRTVAERTAGLVRKHRGSLSGEHGDGRLRGEFIPMMYGRKCYEMMCELKHRWDPDGLFNTGKIVEAPPMDISFRFAEDGSTLADKSLVAMAEQCNGAGDCRKSNIIGGTMCPAYKLSRNELDSTRARANVLRELLTRGNDSKYVYSVPEINEVLDSCLSCKGCHRECPSSVDMTWLKANVMQRSFDEKGTPFRSFAISRMAVVERLGFLLRPIYNFFAGARLSSGILKAVLKFSSERSIPALSRHTMRQLVAGLKSNPSGRRVYLFADEFTNFQESETGLHFAELLKSLGYDVRIPRHFESGRAAISKGCLRYAAKIAVKNVLALKDVISEDAPLVGIEPSCILSFRDEYPKLVPSDMEKEARKLAANCLLYDEFILGEMKAGRITPDSFGEEKLQIWLHGHCHQKSLVGIEKTASVLGLLRGAEVHVIPSGCCGMAGSFGYESEHYATSLAIGEMILFPAVRKAMAGMTDVCPAIIAAPGISCRQQILDGTGHRAIHPIEILYRYRCQTPESSRK